MQHDALSLGRAQFHSLVDSLVESVHFYVYKVMKLKFNRINNNEQEKVS